VGSAAEVRSLHACSTAAGVAGLAMCLVLDWHLPLDRRCQREHTYRFGVALRAIVVVSEIKGNGALTLPVVAAKVELEGARASAQLLVRGYKGNTMGGLLPAWQTFGVDSYGQYMTAISAL
jgi:hypothetical protein